MKMFDTSNNFQVIEFNNNLHMNTVIIGNDIEF